MRLCFCFWWENMKIGDNSEDQAVDRRIVLNRSLMAEG